jgi:hypothetical protein
MRERVKQCAAPCNRGDRLFIFKSGKSLYHSARKQRRKQPVSKEGATALQKEGATINALSPQSNPLPLYTKKKRPVGGKATTGSRSLGVQHLFGAMVVSSQQKPRGLAAQSNRGRVIPLLTRHVVLRNQFCSSVGGRCFLVSGEVDETIIPLEDQDVLPWQWGVVLSRLLGDITGVIWKDSKTLFTLRCRRGSWFEPPQGLALYTSQAAYLIARRSLLPC